MTPAPSRLRPLVGAALFLVLISMLVPSTANAQDGTPELEVTELSTEGRNITVTVVAPPELRSSEITLGSFVVDTGRGLVPPTVEQVPGEDFDVVLLVDVSGSMAVEALAAAKTSGAAFVNQLPTNARVSIVSFGDEAIVVQPFTSNSNEAIATLNTLVAGGETALHAAVVTAAQQFDPRSDSVRTIVLLSDGGNTVGQSSLGRAQAALVASGAKLHAISIETDETNPAELESLAAASGGTVARVEQVESIEALQRAIADELSHHYRLTFTATGGGAQTATIWARSGSQVLAQTVLELSLPVVSTTGPGAGVFDTTVPEATRPSASAPNVEKTIVESSGTLKWISITSMSLAIAVIGLVLMVPGQRTVKRSSAPAQRLGGLRQRDAGRGFRWIASRLADLMEGFLGRGRFGVLLSSRLDAASWKIRTSEFTVLVLLCALVGFLIGATRSLIAGAILAMCVILLFRLILAVKVKRRRSAFANQLTSTLQMLSGALRSGYSLPQAINLVAKEAEAPASDEFARVAVELRLGRDLVESIQAVGERMDNADFAWTTGAIDIARDVGGDLSGVLDNVGETIRTRQRIKRQIQSLSAEGRISAWILIGLPFPIFFWQLIVNREYTMLLFNDPMGQLISMVAATLLVVGIVWLRRQIKIDY